MYQSTDSICIVLFELSYMYIKCSTLILILLLNCCFTICECIYVLFLQNHFVPKLVNLLFKCVLSWFVNSQNRLDLQREWLLMKSKHNEVSQIKMRLAFLRLLKRYQEEKHVILFRFLDGGSESDF